MPKCRLTFPTVHSSMLKTQSRLYVWASPLCRNSVPLAVQRYDGRTHYCTHLKQMTRRLKSFCLTGKSRNVCVRERERNSREWMKPFGSFVESTVVVVFFTMFFLFVYHEGKESFFFFYKHFLSKVYYTLYISRCTIVFFFYQHVLIGKCLKSCDILYMQLLCLDYKRQKCHHVLCQPSQLLHFN